VNEFKVYGKMQVFLAVCDGTEKFMLSNTTVWANLTSAISWVGEEDGRRRTKSLITVSLTEQVIISTVARHGQRIYIVCGGTGGTWEESTLTNDQRIGGQTHD
jgi:hypothetical protein